MRFFEIGLKICTDILSKNWLTRFPNFRKVLKWHQNISDKNEKKMSNIKNMKKKYF